MHGFNHEYDLMLLRNLHADQRRYSQISREFREARGGHRFRSRRKRKRTST